MLNKNQINKIKTLDIGIIYLFGSYAENLHTDKSDIDIGVVSKKIIIDNKRRNEIYMELYDIFSDVYKGKKLDLVFLDRTNLELKFDVINHSKIIYETTTEFRLNFEENVNILYADFKPLLDEFNNMIIGTI
jgi:predicted nucleotidyltransferase